MFCDHLKGIMTEFRGQRMLQLVVTEDHNILKVIEVTFCTDFSDKSLTYCHKIWLEPGERLVK